MKIENKILVDPKQTVVRIRLGISPVGRPKQIFDVAHTLGGGGANDEGDA